MDYIMIIKIVGALLVGALLIGGKKMVNALPTASMAYLMAWLLVGLLYVCCLGLCLLKIMGIDISLETWVSSHKWIIHIILYGITILAMLGGNKKSSKFILHKSTASNSSKTKVVPVPVPSKKKTEAPLRHYPTNKNVKEIKDKVSSGISIRVDWDDTDLHYCFEIVECAKKTKTKVTFYNISRFQFDNMAKMASTVPGVIHFETPVKDAFGALKMAESGACFTFDNSMGTSLLNKIAIAARDSNGYVLIINDKHRNSFETASIKEQCGDHVDFA